MTTTHILAMGGGGFSDEPDNLLLEEHALALARERGGDRPRVCFIGTASGDAETYLLAFYRTFARLGCEVTHLPLFRREAGDIKAVLARQDLIYVGGGNTANLLALWRLHGVDGAVRAAWESGTVLCGVSAGALCWFECGITDSWGTGAAPLEDGLGLVAGSFCPHYDGEEARRPGYQAAISRGMRAGWAADDGAALHLVDGELHEAVASRPGAHVWRLELDEAGEDVIERPLPTRWLGAGAATAEQE